MPRVFDLFALPLGEDRDVRMRRLMTAVVARGRLQVKVTPLFLIWCDPDGPFAASRTLVASLAEGAALDHSQNYLRVISAESHQRKLHHCK